MASAPEHYPWFKKEDTNAFFALFQNNIANFVIIAITLLGFGFPTDIVFGKVIPGAAIAVLVGNFYYAWYASRLARKEGRADVTALSYGISTPIMFVFLFGVILPAYQFTDDAEMAWKIAVAACFFSGLVQVCISFLGAWVKRNLPRAAMLGALAGVALTFIAGQMLFTTYEMPVIGILVLGIIIVGIVGQVHMPFRIPASLFAILIGTGLAYLLGQAEVDSVAEGMEHFGFYPILPEFTWIQGFTYLFGAMAGLLTVVLPITLYNAIETMNNVEAMEAEGDRYDVRECMAVDGVGTMLGALFGGPFPTTVYIASVGAKWMNAGRGYSILNGIVYLFAAMFGLIAALAEIIPTAVVAPLLVFVGLSMISTAFRGNDMRYFPAIVLAMLPYLGNYIATNFGNDAADVMAGVSGGIAPMAEGAMFTGIILGAITVFVIDKDFFRATIFAGIAALLSFIGIMHAEEMTFMGAPDFALGYLILAAFFAFYWLTGYGLDDGNGPADDAVGPQSPGQD
ncbi:hypothetical protein [Aquisalimonas sp.]|uniref:hypothetical protein n=1 Tax=unclassified Aquisalimonas TaxID=2644645 RepID=UPI0025BDAAE4|nr:hypothetical protein [Aquisalimonas sp.]